MIRSAIPRGVVRPRVETDGLLDNSNSFSRSRNLTIHPRPPDVASCQRFHLAYSLMCLVELLQSRCASLGWDNYSCSSHETTIQSNRSSFISRDWYGFKSGGSLTCGQPLLTYFFTCDSSGYLSVQARMLSELMAVNVKCMSSLTMLIIVTVQYVPCA